MAAAAAPRREFKQVLFVAGSLARQRSSRQSQEVEDFPRLQPCDLNQSSQFRSAELESRREDLFQELFPQFWGPVLKRSCAKKQRSTPQFRQIRESLSRLPSIAIQTP